VFSECVLLILHRVLGWKSGSEMRFQCNEAMMYLTMKSNLGSLYTRQRCNGIVKH
jgi:hypothetical protein